MTRKIIGTAIYVLFLLSTHAVYAKDVTVDQAGEIAEKFWDMHMQSTRSTYGGIMFSWDDSALKVATRTNSNASTFYVFKGVAGKGFIIVSAEDQVSPILAYSFEEKAPDYTDLPPAVEAWFDRIIKETEYVRSNGLTNETAAEKWKAPKVGSPVVELETAKWNQVAPYNDQCPMDGDARSVTGCVPTATAIVMKYHKWPASGTGTTEAYKTDTKGIYVAARDLNHSYQWDSMPLTFTTGYSAEAANQVSTLMADIGAAFRIDYGSDATGGSVNRNKFYLHFDYDPGMYYALKENYLEDTWTQMLKDELSSNRPVLYDGAREGGGHQFILDGYTADNYFRVNWGWGGYCDGYFTLTSLAPDEDGGFNYNQGAIFNLKPNTSTEVKNWIKPRSPGIVISKIIGGLSFCVDTLSLVNNTAADFKGKFRGAVTDADGTIKEWITDEYDLSLESGYYTIQNGSVRGTINNPINEGDRIRFFYKSNDSSTWNLIASTNEKNCNWEVVIDEIPVVEEIEDWIKFRSPGIEISETSFVQGQEFVFDKLTFTNRTVDFSGSFRGAVTDKDGNIKEWITSEIKRTLLKGGVYTWYQSVSATIAQSINPGDRIRFFYKYANSEVWRLIKPDNETSCTWEIVIREETTLPADSNSDGVVSIADAVNVVNYILGLEPENFVLDNSDANQDEKITISDAIAVLKIILDSTWTPTRNAVQAGKTTDDCLTVDDFALEKGASTTLQIRLDDSMPYTALQADICMPDGLHIEQITTGARAKGHLLVNSGLDANVVRIGVLSLNNESFIAGGGALLEITVRADETFGGGNIFIENALAADKNATEYALQVRGGHSGTATDIASEAGESTRVVAVSGGIVINHAAGSQVRICTLDGKLQGTHRVQSDTEFHTLQPGAYIVRVGSGVATKVVVK